MGLFKEFREFAMKGSVVDLAVGVIIGGAFGKIVSSLVNDVIMPPLGFIIGGVDFSNKIIILKSHQDLAKKLDGTMAPGGPVIIDTAIRYGTFINNVIDFFIVAMAIFLVIKLMNTARRETPPPPPPVNTKDCPFCATTIPLKARRCPNCTTDLPATA